jgi:hypothetical protein
LGIKVSVARIDLTDEEWNELYKRCYFCGYYDRYHNQELSIDVFGTEIPFLCDKCVINRDINEQDEAPLIPIPTGELFDG